MKENYSVKKIIIFIIIILIISVVFYGLTLLVVEKKKNDVVTPTNESIIQYEEILVGELYRQNESSYYVLATTSKDSNSTSYNSALAVYSAKDNSLATYTINLDNGFNKKYLASESNFEGEFPIFKTSTLLKVENAKITETYEGTNIKTTLENLSNNLS